MEKGAGERMEKGVQANGTKKQTGSAIVICDKVDSKPKLVRRGKNHFILIKVMLHQGVLQL